MSYRFGFYNQTTGAFIGEIDHAYERRMTLVLNNNCTASCRVPLADPIVDKVNAVNGDVLMAVFQDGDIEFIGDLAGIDEGGAVNENEGPSVTFTASGPLEMRLDDRLVGMPYPTAQAQWVTPRDAGLIIQDMVDQTNKLSEGNGDSGIRIGTFDALYATTLAEDQSIAFKPIGETIRELQQSKVAYPFENPPASTLFVADGFSGSGFVDGRTDETPGSPNTWLTFGSAPDWNVAGTQAQRQAAAASSGRFMVNSAAPRRAVLHRAAFRCTVPSSTAYSDFLSASLYVRHRQGTPPNVTTNQQGLFLVVDYADPSAPAGAKCTVGMTSLSSTYTLGSWFPGALDTSFYIQYLLVDEDGNWRAALQHLGDPFPGWGATGNRSELATGGDLEDGGLAWRDAAGAGAGLTQWILGDIYGNDYTGPQSFDFELEPTKPTPDTIFGSPGLQIAKLNVKLRIGTQKPHVVFEYGDGTKDIEDYKRLTDRSKMVTRVYVLPPGFDPGASLPTDVATATNAGAKDIRGLHEEVVASDIMSQELRQALAEATVAIRGGARSLITWTPGPLAPKFGRSKDYIVGDVVRARARVNGVARFDGWFRVWGVEVTIDDFGVVKVVPALVPE